MNEVLLSEYKFVRENGVAFYEQKRGLIEVSGKEAVQFLNGLITNDVAGLAEDAAVSAAFPNAAGRLLAVVRVLRKNGIFLFETEESTHEKVFNNLFRFTYAGDFFVEDLSEDYRFFQIFNFTAQVPDAIALQTNYGSDYFVPKESAGNFKAGLLGQNAVEIGDELYEVLRVENGIPKYGVDMDETTIVPEIGLENLISYNKGCYIGQEIIARIHFRGHIAKQLTGLIFADENATAAANDEIKSLDGKNAGKVTSAVFSPKLEKQIALAYVRYDYLAEGTELKIGDWSAAVKNLPFVSK